MTIEQKAQRYNEALKKAKKLYEQGTITESLSYVFPELNESEDERIRKELLEHCKNQAKPYIQTGNKCPQIQSWIDWLEKQGEIVEYYEDKLDRCACENFNKGYKEALEKQDEQKPADKIEPKFHEGDWVIDKQGIIHQISNVVENVTNHTYGYDIVGGGYLNDNTEGIRLWTIKDAKNGDVLFDGSNILLVKKINNWHNITSYLAYSQVYGIRKYLISNSDVITPATKEQHDLLFQKMKEAGYEWDAEKLEPIKVPKTKEPEGALKKLLDEQDKFYKEAKIVLEDKDTALAFLRRTGIIDEYGELAEKYRSEQTPATTISAVNGTISTAITDGNTSVTNKEVEKQYCTGQYEPDVREFPIEWKPSDEQMEAMQKALVDLCGKDEHNIITGFYYDLKKLKG